MAVNLIDLLSKEFGGDVVRKLAGSLGEPESKVQAALGGLAPALVTGVVNKSSSSQGLSDLFNMMKSGGFDGRQAPNLGSLLEGGGGGLADLTSRGAPSAAALLGSRYGVVTDWIGSLAGIGAKSATSLLSLATPVLLSLIGRAAQKNGAFTKPELGQLLDSQTAFLPEKMPAGLASALGVTDAPKFVPIEPPHVSKVQVIESERTNWLPWLLVPLLALLGWWWFANRAPVGTINPKVAVVNDDGRIICSASVRDEATKDAILQALRASFGGSTSCDIAVDANIKAISWLPNAAGIFAALKRPGTEFTLDGTSVQLGGWLSAAERNASLNSLRGLLGTDYTLAEGADKATSVITDANTKAMAALAALTGAFSPEAFSNAMNMAVINFASGSSMIPADSAALIAEAASVLKTAPAGTVIEVSGHTDNTGDAASNMTLSEARAEAVRTALIAAGVGDSMLMAKGYGETRPVASNDTEHGRFRNRRIEYSVVTRPPA